MSVGYILLISIVCLTDGRIKRNRQVAFELSEFLCYYFTNGPDLKLTGILVRNGTTVLIFDGFCSSRSVGGGLSYD